MKTGDLIRFKDFWHDRAKRATSSGLIVTEYDPRYTEESRLFEIMIGGRLVRAFEYEIEVVGED